MSIFSRKPNVKKMIEERDLEGLMEALNHKNNEVTLNAAFGLVLLGDAAMLKPYVWTLKNQDFSILESDKRDLARLEIPRVGAHGFINMLKNSDLTTRWSGAVALANMGTINGFTAAIVKPLINLLDEETHWSVRGLAIVVLGKIGMPAVEDLAHALNDENRDVRLGAVMALEFIGGEGVIETLRVASEDGDSVVQKAAKEALVKIKAGEPAGTVLGG